MKWPERHALDPHAEFYSRALALAVQIRSPFVALWRLTVATLVAMAITMLVWIGFQVSDRAIPVRNVRTALQTPSMPPLGRVLVHFDLERTRICAVDISSSIIDGKDDIRPLVTLHRDAAGPVGADHFTRSFEVPSEAAAGKARLRIAWAYVCPGNYAQALSPVLLMLPDIAFEIAAPPIK